MRRGTTIVLCGMLWLAAGTAQAATTRLLTDSCVAWPLGGTCSAWITCNTTIPPSTYVPGSGAAVVLVSGRPSAYAKVTSQGPISNGYKASFINNNWLSSAQGTVSITCRWP